MVSEREVRRSGRRTIRPVEFWNFEKPDASKSETIIYKQSDLSKCSVFNIMSTKYINGNNSVPVENRTNKTSTRSVKKNVTIQDGQERHSRKLQASTSNANSNIHKAKFKKIGGKNNTSKTKENKEMSIMSKVSKGSRDMNEAKVPQEQPTELMSKETNDQENVSSVLSTIKSDWLPYKSIGMRKIQKLPVASLTPKNSINNSSLNQMMLEQPSFQNILSSTIVDSSSTSKLWKCKQAHLPRSSISGNANTGIFKVPSLPPCRHLKKSSMMSQLSIFSIPEECETNVSRGTVSLVTTGSEVPPQACQTKDTSTLQKNAPNQIILKPPRLSTVKGSHKRCDEQTEEAIDPGRSVVLLSTTEASTNNDETVSIRRSGRVRTKPLEFWNFEKVEVRTLENGKVNIIHHKQELLHPIKRKKRDKESQTSLHSALNSSKPKSLVGQSPQKPSPASSLSKRKLFSPTCNNLDETAKTEDGQPFKRKRSLERNKECPVTPTIKVTKFNDLNFIETVTKQCKCYLARSFQDKEFDIYAGFAFLEWGQLVWVTTRETKLFVIEGRGTLKMTDEMAKGKVVRLETRKEAAIASGKKVSIVKDGRYKMLKLFVFLESTTTTSSSSSIMDVSLKRCSLSPR